MALIHLLFNGIVYPTFVPVQPINNFVLYILKYLHGCLSWQCQVYWLYI